MSYNDYYYSSLENSPPKGTYSYSLSLSIWYSSFEMYIIKLDIQIKIIRLKKQFTTHYNVYNFFRRILNHQGLSPRINNSLVQ
jgi:hypothetical protein